VFRFGLADCSQLIGYDPAILQDVIEDRAKVDKAGHVDLREVVNPSA
jgi:hypothetical protein